MSQGFPDNKSSQETIGFDYVYLLEHCMHDKPTIIGVFSTFEEAKVGLRTLPKEWQYTVYAVPLNRIITQGVELRDVQGELDHWHFGTYELDSEYYDDDGNFVRKCTDTKIVWPE